MLYSNAFLISIFHVHVDRHSQIQQEGFFLSFFFCYFIFKNISAAFVVDGYYGIKMRYMANLLLLFVTENNERKPNYFVMLDLSLYFLKGH